MDKTTQQLKELKKQTVCLMITLKQQLKIFDNYKKGTQNISPNMVKARSYAAQKFMLLTELLQFINYAMDYLRDHNAKDFAFLSYVDKISSLTSQYKEKLDFCDELINSQLDYIRSTTDEANP